MNDIPALIAALKAQAWQRAAGNTLIAAEQLIEWHAAAAFERLTTLPLPEEIAGLIERLNNPALVMATGAPTMLDFVSSTSDMKSAAAALQRLAQEVERLNERLENNHLYEHKDGQMVRVEVSPGSIPDGIDCRNETIKLQDERNDRLAARITELEAHCIRLGQGGAERYWEERWRTDNARIAELEADLKQHQDLNAAEHEILLQVHAERDAIRAKTIEKCIDVLERLPWADKDQNATLIHAIGAIRTLARNETDSSMTQAVVRR